MIIKIWNGSSFVERYPKTNIAAIVATGTPQASNFLRGDGSWANTINGNLGIRSSTSGTAITHVPGFSSSPNGTTQTVIHRTIANFKVDLALNNVQNYGIATQAEAEAGTATNKYMTPQRTKQAIEKLHPPFPTFTSASVAASGLSTWENKMIRMSSTSNRTVEIAVSTTWNPPVGTEIHVMRFNSGKVQIIAQSGVTLYSAESHTYIEPRYGVVTIKKVLTDTWVIFGALAAS